MRVGASGSTPDDLRARTSLSFAMARGCLSAPQSRVEDECDLAGLAASVSSMSETARENISVDHTMVNDRLRRSLISA
jgi:hypothetical protein